MHGSRRRWGVVAVVCVTALGVPGVVVGAGQKRASASSDFRLAPHQGNPQPDSTGRGAWVFMQSAVASVGTPKAYSPLRIFTSSAFGISRLEQWTGSYQSGTPDSLPAVGVNATRSDQRLSSFTWPKGTMRMHPGPNLAAVLAWRARKQGTSASVRGTVTKLDQTCGTGVFWALEDSDGKAKAAGTLPGTSKASHSFKATISLPAGKALYFVVGPNGSFFCDSTMVSLIIVPS